MMTAIICCVHWKLLERQAGAQGRYFHKRTIEQQRSSRYPDEYASNDLAIYMRKTRSPSSPARMQRHWNRNCPGRFTGSQTARLDAPTFVLAEEYLSGNVREKLREAKAAAEQHPIYQPNVTALERGAAGGLKPAEISVRLGSTWVPESDIQQFVWELLQPPWYMSGRIKVHYSPYTGAWQIRGTVRGRAAAFTHRPPTAPSGSAGITLWRTA